MGLHLEDDIGVLDDPLPEKIFRRTLDLEGGFTSDEGGDTNLGITQTILDSYNRRQGLPKQSVKTIDENKAWGIYDEEFYQRPGLNKLPENVGSLLFDYGVHSGPGRAVKSLQKEIGTAPDGIIGPKTLNATQEYIRKNGERSLLQNLMDDRVNFFKTTPAFRTKSKGLMNRIETLKKEFDLNLLNPFSVKEAAADEISLEDDAGIFQDRPELIDDAGILGTFEPEKPSFMGHLRKVIIEGPPPSREEKTPIFERIGKGFGTGVTGMVEGVGGVAKWFGVDGLGDNINKYADEMKKFYEVPDPDFTTQVSAGFGSMATFLIPGLGVSRGVQALSAMPRLAAWLGASASSVMEASVEAGGAYNRSIVKGVEHKEASEAATKDFWLNLPVLVFTNKFGLFGDKGGAILKGIKTSGGESVQEFTQQLVGNFATKDPLMEGALESAAVGAVVGGGTGAVLGFAERKDLEKYKAKDLEKLEKEEEIKAPAEPVKEEVVTEPVKPPEAVSKEPPVSPKAEPISQSAKDLQDKQGIVEPSPSASLKAEARKYKSAEEFVEAQLTHSSGLKIKTPIIQTSEGKIFEGITHSEAFRKAVDVGEIIEVGKNKGKDYSWEKREKHISEYTNKEGKPIDINWDLFKLNNGDIIDRLTAGRSFGIHAGEQMIEKKSQLTALWHEAQKEGQPPSHATPQGEIVEQGASVALKKEKAVFKISKKADVWNVPTAGYFLEKGGQGGNVPTKKITSEKVQQIYQDTLTDIEFSEEGDFVVIKGYPKKDLTAKEKKSISSYGSFRGKPQQVLPTPAKTTDEFTKRVEQLNKFAQRRAILRKGAHLKKFAGQFHPIPKEGEVKLTQDVLINDREYMTVLAHELGHAIEYNVTGKIGRGFKIFGDLDTATNKKIRKELESVTEDLVGKAAMENGISGDKGYYLKSTELIARFFEKILVSPGNIEELAPTAYMLIEEQSVKHPIIHEFFEAARGEIDAGEPKVVLLRDLRQIHQKYLGKRVGDIAYGEYIVWRAMKERAKIKLQELIDQKFKNVKDAPDLLFKAAESIKISRGGIPDFGTRDFFTAHTEEERLGFEKMGFEKMPLPVLENGKAYPQYARARYTKEEAQQFFNSLSSEGRKLILDFTAERSEAKDYFNREVIKDINHIEGNIEGWVYHYFEDRPGSPIIGGEKFKRKIAGTRRKREGATGYVEDFKKAMSKVLVDLEGEKAFNDFVKRYFAMVTRPIAEGAEPIPGWVEVVGTLKTGVGLPQEKKVTLIDKATGEKIPVRQTRYQMPKDIYERFKLWRGLIDEAGMAVRIINDINRYWRVNILAHPGTAATNFNSGGIQYSAKILTDFYTEVLTGDIAMPKTKGNISAMIKVLLPKGWNNTPDWVYGSDLSNFYGQFMKQKSPVSQAIDEYGNKALKLFGLYERYWKKVIMLSENVADLESLNKMTPEGLRLPTEEERDLIRQINEAVDLYGYDYDNVPTWLEVHQKSAMGQAIKPFAKYPYKYAKQVLDMIGSAFDGTLPPQERIAKIMALATIVSVFAMFAKKRKEEQKTPVAGLDIEIPARLQTRGRLFLTTDEQGRELFMRVAKYPFINLTQTGMEFVDGSWEGGKDALSDMLGSIGPAAQVGLLAFNYRNKYQTYDSVPVILGDSLATFTPGYRILNDVSRMLDPFQRKQETFGQTFTKLIPTTDETLQEKLHGKIRTERIPDEGEIKGAKGKRTTIDAELENYWQDILLSMLSGVYVTRIDPKIAEAYIIRKEKNFEKKKKKEEKENE